MTEIRLRNIDNDKCINMKQKSSDEQQQAFSLSFCQSISLFLFLSLSPSIFSLYPTPSLCLSSPSLPLFSVYLSISFHFTCVTYRRTEVIMLFLYGMCVRPLVAFSYKATITISRKKREVLIYFASVSTDPELFVLPTLSLPARSTKWSLDLLIMSDPRIE